MIRIQQFNVGGRKQRMYENQVAVGALRRNENTNQDRASNQLIQFFLRKFFVKHPEIFPRGSTKSSVFLLDGNVGPQTLEGISRFQAFQSRNGIPLFQDSRVSVATGVNVPGTGKRFTIHVLNSFFFLTAGQKAFDNLFKDPEINAEAPELRDELVRQELLQGP